MRWHPHHDPFVIPALPGWRAAYSEAQGLPDDEPLDEHVYCRPVVAWEVRKDEDGALQLWPMVSSGLVVEAEGNEPDLLIEPGRELEEYRFALTYDREVARKRRMSLDAAEVTEGSER
jgi:hypothetical protein